MVYLYCSVLKNEAKIAAKSCSPAVPSAGSSGEASSGGGCRVGGGGLARFSWLAGFAAQLLSSGEVYPRHALLTALSIKTTKVHIRIRVVPPVHPFSTAVPFWGQTTSYLSGLSPKRDCGSKRVKSPPWRRTHADPPKGAAFISFLLRPGQFSSSYYTF